MTRLQIYRAVRDSVANEPTRRLTADTLEDDNGLRCAVGCAMDNQAICELFDSFELGDDAEAIFTEIIWQNDFAVTDPSSRHRWDRMMKWLDSEVNRMERDELERLAFDVREMAHV